MNLRSTIAQIAQAFHKHMERLFAYSKAISSKDEQKSTHQSRCSTCGCEKVVWMTQRRTIINESIMFITTNVAWRKPLFANDAYAHEAVETLYRVQEFRPFVLYGFVIMPNHVHFLLRVPEPETISAVMRIYKRSVSQNIGLGPFWQPRFHLRLPENASVALHYTHWNPVKAGLVEKPEDYKWSSANKRWDVTPLPWNGW